MSTVWNNLKAFVLGIVILGVPLWIGYVCGRNDEFPEFLRVCDDLAIERQLRRNDAKTIDVMTENVREARVLMNYSKAEADGLKKAITASLMERWNGIDAAVDAAAPEGRRLDDGTEPPRRMRWDDPKRFPHPTYRGGSNLAYEAFAERMAKFLDHPTVRLLKEADLWTSDSVSIGTLTQEHRTSWQKLAQTCVEWKSVPDDVREKIGVAMRSGR